jgi:hypothetical protein
MLIYSENLGRLPISISETLFSQVNPRRPNVYVRKGSLGAAKPTSGIDTPILQSPSPKQFEDDDENERRCECLASPESIRHRGGPPAQEYRLRLKPPSPHV